MTIRWTPLLIAAGLSLSLAALADPGQGPPPRRGPPPEALEACVDLVDGDACAFTTPRGDVLEGTCTAGPRGEPPACRPANAPEHAPPRRTSDQACEADAP